MSHHAPLPAIVTMGAGRRLETGAPVWPARRRTFPVSGTTMIETKTMNHSLRSPFQSQTYPAAAPGTPCEAPGREHQLGRRPLARTVIQLAGSATAWIALAYLISEPSGVLPGTRLGGTPVDGMSRAMLAGVVRERTRQLATGGRTITVRADGQSVRLKLAAGAVSAETDHAWSECYLLGRELDPFQRLAARWKAACGGGNDVPLRLRVSDRLAREAAASLRRNPTDARFAPGLVAAGQTPRVLPEQPGVAVEPAAVRRALEDGLAAGAATVTVPDQALPAAQTAAGLTGLRFRIAACETPIVTRNAASRSNMGLLARLIDGTVLAPGERYSVNARIGERTTGEGFLAAPILLRGVRHATDIAGGICQTSTTLFGAAMRADFAILKRQSHSKPARYCRLGYDSTLDYTAGKDLVFANTAGCGRAALRLWGDGRRMHAEVWAERPLPAPVRLTDRVTRSTDGRWVEVTLIRLVSGSKEEIIGRSVFVRG